MGAKIQNLTPTNRNQNFETYPAFSSQWSSQNYIWDFWNFEFPTFNDFFVLTLLCLITYCEFGMHG